MKNITKYLLIGAILAGVASTASASVTLSIEPSAQTINVGESATYNLWVNGLSSTTHLGGFAVQINYDSSIANALSASYGSVINDNPFSDLTVSGQVYAANTSFATDLSGQPFSFILASFTLQGVGLGATTLTIDHDWSYLSNAEGTGNLAFTTQDGSLTVVPEPSTVVASTLLLLPFGISALRLLRKKQTA